jgi:hypothetical protein
MLRHYFPVLLLALVCRGAFAECECLWRGSFSDVQADADLVISGSVVATAGNSVDLDVERLLRGTHHGETLRVWLKTADYCRPDVELFPVGSEWVMALHAIREEVPGWFNPSTPNVSYGRVGDYSLSSCGGYWLARQGDLVSGNLVDGPRWVREPRMAPVLLDIVEDYVQGRLERDDLRQASREDPRLRELMLDTRTFIRNEN